MNRADGPRGRRQRPLRRSSRNRVRASRSLAPARSSRRSPPRPPRLLEPAEAALHLRVAGELEHHVREVRRLPMRALGEARRLLDLGARRGVASAVAPPPPLTARDRRSQVLSWVSVSRRGDRGHLGRDAQQRRAGEHGRETVVHPSFRRRPDRPCDTRRLRPPRRGWGRDRTAPASRGAWRAPSAPWPAWGRARRARRAPPSPRRASPPARRSSLSSSILLFFFLRARRASAMSDPSTAAWPTALLLQLDDALSPSIIVTRRPGARTRRFLQARGPAPPACSFEGPGGRTDRGATAMASSRSVRPGWRRAPLRARCFERQAPRLDQRSSTVIVARCAHEPGEVAGRRRSAGSACDLRL